MTDEVALVACVLINFFVCIIKDFIKEDDVPPKIIKIIDDPNIPDGYIIFMGNVKVAMPGMNKVLVGIDWSPREVEAKGGEEKLLPTLLDLIEVETKKRQKPT